MKMKLDETKKKFDGMKMKLDETKKKLDGMKKNLDGTKKNLDGTQKILSSMEKILKQVLKNKNCCAPPWEIYGGMCLLYSKKQKNWNDANKFCNQYGGHLAWLVDGSEHDLAREFFNMKSGDHAYCYIGLHRSGGTVQWTGFNSPYRGNLKYIKENYLYFRLYYKSRAIYGTHPDSSEEFLCRRA